MHQDVTGMQITYTKLYPYMLMQDTNASLLRHSLEPKCITLPHQVKNINHKSG